MNVLTFNLGTKAARFLAKAGWSRDHINSVLRGDNFISKSTFQDIQEEIDQFVTLQAKFAAPNALNFAQTPTFWKTSTIDTDDVTPESAALVLRKGGWTPDDIQSVLKSGDKHASEIDWQYINDEASKTKVKKRTSSSSEEGGNIFGGIIFVVICLMLLFALIGG